MKIVIEGKNIELTKALKDYVNEKLHRLRDHYEQIIKGHEVKVKLSVLKNPRITDNNITEVTIFLNGRIIRSEHASEDMYASIDLVADKLERQIQKYKAQVYRSYQHKERPLPVSEASSVLLPRESLENHKNELDEKIIRQKSFTINPMTPEEALTELNLVNHDFYVFTNSRTKKINVIYKRKHGDYGLIQPEI